MKYFLTLSNPVNAEVICVNKFFRDTKSVLEYIKNAFAEYDASRGYRSKLALAKNVISYYTTGDERYLPSQKEYDVRDYINIRLITAKDYVRYLEKKLSDLTGENYISSSPEKEDEEVKVRKRKKRSTKPKGESKEESKEDQDLNTLDQLKQEFEKELS